MSKYLHSALFGTASITGTFAAFFWGKSSPTDQSLAVTGNSMSSTNSTGSVSVISDPQAPPATLGQVNPSAFFKYGFPGPVHDLQNRHEFVSVYDRQTRNPYYVVEHITAESLKNGGQVDRKKAVFKEDEKIPQKYRAQLRDYFRSGYDRGHQAPAADAKFSQEAMNETFYLTNISPQVGDGFNRDYWAYLEFFTRELAKKYQNVRIVTGPLYLPKKCPDGKWRVEYEVIGNTPNIAVPTHFFKLIVADKGTDDLSVAAFVLPNDKINNSTPLKSFQVPIEALERSSGLQFLQNVPDYNKKNLCKETTCEIIVKEFNNALPHGNIPLALPAPK